MGSMDADLDEQVLMLSYNYRQDKQIRFAIAFGPGPQQGMPRSIERAGVLVQNLELWEFGILPGCQT